MNLLTRTKSIGVISEELATEVRRYPITLPWGPAYEYDGGRSEEERFNASSLLVKAS